MGLGFGFELRQEQRQELTQQTRLTQKQQKKLRLHLLNTRADLAHALHGERYTPAADCPKCGHILSHLEIVKGFSRNVRDFDTTCPKCKKRFRALLRNSRAASSVQVYLYCPAQTLDQLLAVQLLPPAKIDASVRLSAIHHFGGLRQAFGKLGIDYTLEPRPAKWEEKVRDYLGQLPDTVIARIARQKVEKIRALRQSFGISRYRSSDWV